MDGSLTIMCGGDAADVDFASDQRSRRSGPGWFSPVPPGGDGDESRGTSFWWGAMPLPPVRHSSLRAPSASTTWKA